MPPFPLAQAFCQHLPDGAPKAAPDAALEGALLSLGQHGQTAWPTIDLPVLDFVHHLSRHLPPELDPLAFLAAVAAADLYLACACARGIPAALVAFDQSLLTRVAGFVARVDRSPAFADEVRQVLRERLLCAPSGTAPRIAAYGGIGALRSFVRVTALRTALDLRKGRPEEPVSDIDNAARRALPLAGDAELRFVQAHHRADLQQALKDAFAALPREQRNVLRLHFVSGLTGERIAEILQVNRTTVGRWLASARAAIFQETRRLLRDRLRLPPADVDSLIQAIRSQFEASIADLLAVSQD